MAKVLMSFGLRAQKPKLATFDLSEITVSGFDMICVSYSYLPNLIC